MNHPQRVAIQNVSPEIDGGRYPIKRVVGESVNVEADVFIDGHDLISCEVRHRSAGARDFESVPMHPIGNDRWEAVFKVTEVGETRYTFHAWVNRFLSWRDGFKKKVEAGVEAGTDFRQGMDFLNETLAKKTDSDDHRELSVTVNQLQKEGATERGFGLIMDENLAVLMDRIGPRGPVTTYEKELRVTVDRTLARTGAWYEFFPRSCPGRKNQHGTFKDCQAFLPTVADMGFDVVYFPPIHPIGEIKRKGKSNNMNATAEDVGSPWAIGSKVGGHKSIHPQLGSLDDFKNLIATAKKMGLEVALDLAYQCSPDHPYVREHPEWFGRRPDGSIQYAENPPKKYEDIVPLDFDTSDWEALWNELKSVVDYWIDQGVKIFRVDNPHTKPFGFWEWLISEVKKTHPDVLFLSEAFTRPKIMYHLAKLGFTQSYNYFPWRNHKQELTAYFEELTQTDVRDYFRPNLWPNTPDILTEYLQTGGRPAFMIRYLLAATLGASYGVYGPAFELCEHRPREKGSEEYLNSDKYELKKWNVDKSESLRHLMSHANAIRRANPALQTNTGLQFHFTNNDKILCFSKISEDGLNKILVIINLDPFHRQSAMVSLPLESLGLPEVGAYRVYDLLTNIGYLWNSSWNFVELNPFYLPAHIFRLERIT